MWNTLKSQFVLGAAPSGWKLDYNNLILIDKGWLIHSQASIGKSGGVGKKILFIYIMATVPELPELVHGVIAS